MGGWWSHSLQVAAGVEVCVIYFMTSSRDAIIEFAHRESADSLITMP